MMNRRTLYLVGIFAITALVAAAMFNRANAATTEDLERDAAQALELLYKNDPVALQVSKRAKAVLVFPNVVKAGLIFGGAYGEGVLKKGSKVDGYFNSFTGSWGLQAGAQSYSYAVFLMTDEAMEYLDSSRGWEIGVGPTVVVMDEGAAKNLSTSTMKDAAYAFIFNQQGLMAGISIEGTKITRIKN
ncbi:YSC84-related protein [Parvibaculum sp.]|uniref:lipid-binding SYLF domain-containing protein n=1 Tax=Parvibaculum sp. TaxID=2024848 RepID=UPI00391D40A6